MNIPPPRNQRILPRDAEERRGDQAQDNHQGSTQSARDCDEHSAMGKTKGKMMKRTLTVEEFNGPRRSNGKTGASTIRLKGKWLAALGFAPGHTVELTAVSPGVLEIRLTCPPKPDHIFEIAAMRLDHAIAAGKSTK